MKKNISIILVILSLVLMLQASAEDTKSSNISYNEAEKIMMENSNSLKKQIQSERKAFFQYNNSVQSTRGLSTDGGTVDTAFGEIKFKYPVNIRTILTKAKEFYPQQYKYGWEMTDKGKTVTQKALSLGLRELYMGFLKADTDYDLGLKKFDLAVRKYEINKLKLERGLISQIEFEEAQYEYLKAQKNLDAAKRNRENMQRSLNSFIGVPIDTKYEAALYEEMSIRNVIEPLENYVEKSLEQRLEIISIIEEIKLKKMYISILERNNAHEIYTDSRKEHSGATRELESLNIMLEKTKLDIENNIKSAFIDLKKESFTVQNMSKTMDIQRNSFEKLKSQYEQGLVPKISIDEYELGLQEIQNNFNLVVYMYNTKAMKLKEASGLGPAY